MIIEALTDKDDSKAYAMIKQIAAASELSDEFYSCPELSPIIENELELIDVSCYKDSIIPLILRDIAELTGLINETDR